MPYLEVVEAVEAEAVDVVTDEYGTEGELGESIDSNLLSGGAVDQWIIWRIEDGIIVVQIVVEVVGRGGS